MTPVIILVSIIVGVPFALLLYATHKGRVNAEECRKIIMKIQACSGGVE